MLKFEKRVTNGWGGRINYTYSRLKDNQFGEANFFSQQLRPRRRTPTTSMPSTAIGLLDVPHKIDVLADHRTAVRRRQALGAGRRRQRRSSATGRSRRSSRSRAASRLQVYATTPTRRTCSRACSASNPGTGDAETDGTRDERIAPPPARAASPMMRHRHLAERRRVRRSPPAFTLGTLPRTLDDVRTPHRNNWDFVGQPRTSASGAACAARSGSKC